LRLHLSKSNFFYVARLLTEGPSQTSATTR